MYCYQFDVTFQEVPTEISLVLSISGCPHRCHGCHSVELWKKDNGTLLTDAYFFNLLKRYKGYVTCICFFGGEWHPLRLAELCSYSRKFGLKTCLYTGANDVPESLKKELDFLKIGPWIEALGGLESIHTNQRFINVATGATMNHLFHTHGGLDVTVN